MSKFFDGRIDSAKLDLIIEVKEIVDIESNVSQLKLEGFKASIRYRTNNQNYGVYHLEGLLGFMEFLEILRDISLSDDLMSAD